MKGLTQNVPKALVQVAGKTLLEYGVERLLEAGIERITIAVGWKGAMIRDAVAKFENNSILKIVNVPNYEVGPLQTLTTAISEDDAEETLVYPVDLLITSSSVKMIIANYAVNRDAIATLAVDPDSTSGSIVSVDSQGRAIGIQKEMDDAASIVRSAMLMIASPGFCDHCKTALNQGSTKVVSVLNDLIEKGHTIQTYNIDEKWFDADTLSDVLEINRFLIDSPAIDYRESIFVPAGDTMDIGDTLILGTGIEIDSGVSLKGPCLIRRNSKIGKNSEIGPHVSLDCGTEVGTNCVIQNAVIFGQSKIPNKTNLSGIVMYDSEGFKVEE